jgi:colanic acid biosynthesis glycosyl transferase WcaI
VNILMLTASFPPEIGSASDLFHELARSMIRRGHKVTVVTTFPRHYSYRFVDKESLPKASGRLSLTEYMDGIRVIRLRGLPLLGGSLLARGIEHFLLPPILTFGALFSGKYDVILIYSPPLPLAVIAYFLSRVKRIPLVANIQDLYPQAVVDSGLLRNRLLIRVFEVMERFVYKKADYLTVHSEGNRDYLISKGASRKKVMVIPNWADTDEIKLSPKHNQFRREYNLDGKFVISYAGIMSPAQGLDNIIHCAALLNSNNEVLFLMVGDGLEKNKLMAEAEKLKLTNVKFFPMQPKTKYSEVLHASDACLVTLKRGKTTPVVPAKLIRIMSSGRPVIASVPLDGDVPKIVAAARCGLVVEPENPDLLAQAILKLYNNPSLAEELGKNGRKYAEKHFSLEACTTKYENLFREVCRERQSGAKA